MHVHYWLQLSLNMFCQKLAKLDNVCQSGHKHKSVTFILGHSVYTFVC